MLTYPHPLQTKMLSGGSCSLVVEQGHQLDLGGLPLAGKTGRFIHRTRTGLARMPVQARRGLVARLARYESCLIDWFPYACGTGLVYVQMLFGCLHIERKNNFLCLHVLPCACHVHNGAWLQGNADTSQGSGPGNETRGACIRRAWLS